MSIILIKLSGPLQSWGTTSSFETRHTDFYPSKSGVIGMIAASLGLKRDDTETISKLNKLEFAVRVDQYGSLLRDYHTARKFDAKGKFVRTYVTNRYYLEDFVFVVALGHNDENFISEIKNALAKPYFQTFMGRRANPLPWDFLLDDSSVESNSVIDVLKVYEWQAALWYKRKFKEQAFKTEIFADANLLNSTSQTIRRDKVVSFSQKNRKFVHRYEKRVVVEIQNNIDVREPEESEHDIFTVLGD